MVYTGNMKTTVTTSPIVSNRSWPRAYKAFLCDRHQSLLLKIAPIAILVGSPEIVASNVLPVIGEIADIGGLTLASVVAIRTYNAVKRYR